MSVLLYLVIFILGACLGSQLNRGIYRLAWDKRAIGPWSSPHPDAPSRRLADRIPILGWCLLRREASIHGRLFWVRPLLIELAAGAGFAVVYWWVVRRGGLMPSAVRPLYDVFTLHVQYLVHVLLISLMTVATFIDFDEKTIPDWITVPGTLIGLIIMAALPVAALPVATGDGVALPVVGQLSLTSPGPWSALLNGQDGLWIGLACFAGWCFAIWPKTITRRRGLLKAVRYAAVSMFRFPGWWLLVGLMLVGMAAITITWRLGEPWWPSLLSSLVGMAFGGGLIWAVRLVGGSALGKEAMGFGDVTLMAMIGAYVGWQPSIMIFFLAPFVAVFICLTQWMVTQRRDIAFGPYLCAATLVVMLRWSAIWERQAHAVFALGWLIPQLIFFCLILLGGMLSLWRLIERALTGGRH